MSEDSIFHRHSWEVYFDHPDYRVANRVFFPFDSNNPADEQVVLERAVNKPLVVEDATRRVLVVYAPPMPVYLMPEDMLNAVLSKLNLPKEQTHLEGSDIAEEVHQALDDAKKKLRAHCEQARAHYRKELGTVLARVFPESYDGDRAFVFLKAIGDPVTEKDRNLLLLFDEGLPGMMHVLPCNVEGHFHHRENADFCRRVKEPPFVAPAYLVKGSVQVGEDRLRHYSFHVLDSLVSLFF